MRKIIIVLVSALLSGPMIGMENSSLQYAKARFWSRDESDVALSVFSSLRRDFAVAFSANELRYLVNISSKFRETLNQNGGVSSITWPVSRDALLLLKILTERVNMLAFAESYRHADIAQIEKDAVYLDCPLLAETLREMMAVNEAKIELPQNAILSTFIAEVNAKKKELVEVYKGVQNNKQRRCNNKDSVDFDAKKLVDDQNSIIERMVSIAEKARASFVDEEDYVEQHRIDELREYVRRHLIINQHLSNRERAPYQLIQFYQNLMNLLKPIISEVQKDAEKLLKATNDGNYDDDFSAINRMHKRLSDQYLMFDVPGEVSAEIEKINDSFNHNLEGLKATVEEKFLERDNTVYLNVRARYFYSYAYKCLLSLAQIEEIINELAQNNDRREGLAAALEIELASVEEVIAKIKKAQGTSLAAGSKSNIKTAKKRGKNTAITNRKRKLKKVPVIAVQPSAVSISEEPATDIIHSFCPHEEKYLPTWRDRRLDGLARMLNFYLTKMSRDKDFAYKPLATAISMAKIDNRLVLFVGTKNNLDESLIHEALRAIMVEANELRKEDLAQYKKFYTGWLRKLWSVPSNPKWNGDPRTLRTSITHLRYKLDLEKLFRMTATDNEHYDAELAFALRNMHVDVVPNPRNFHPELTVAQYFAAIKDWLKTHGNDCAYIGTHLKNCLPCHLLIYGTHQENSGKTIIGISQPEFRFHTHDYFDYIYRKTVLPKCCIYLNDMSNAELSKRIHLNHEQASLETLSMLTDLSESE